MPTEIQEIKDLLKELVLSQKETDSKFKQTDSKFNETDQRIKKAFDLFETEWGKLVESLVEGDLIPILQSKNINVHDTSLRRKGSYNGQNFEFDIIVNTTSELIIVEVKTTLRVNDVKHFVNKLSHARLWLNEYKDFTVYGAMAFLREESGSAALAEKEKLFVIKATGNSAAIINK
ncbi:MAG: hypothetical protein WBO36_16370, partial [Saprospiraceae bacterium]